jgi:hypothetical protein
VVEHDPKLVAAQPSVEPASTGVRVASSQEGGGILRGDPIEGYLGEPVPQEHSGWHGRLFAVWARGGEDKEATRRETHRLDAVVRDHDLRPLAYFVGCGPSLCRARFRFDDQKELHRMNSITLDGLEIAATFPVFLGDEFVDVSVYWSSDGGPLAEAASVEAFMETGDPWMGL